MAEQRLLGLYQIQSGDANNTSLEDKMSDILGGVGLETDGTYSANTGANYIDEATSLKDADNKLDTELKNVNDKIDAAIQGIKWKEPVRVTTTEALPSFTYADGVITASANGALPQIDGKTLVVGNRILVRYDGENNGIYTVTTVGDENTAFVLTRTDDANIASEFPQMAVFVQEGTVNADMAFVLTNDGAITLGTTALTYVQFTGLGQIEAGAALSKTGNRLDVEVDNSTIEVSEDKLQVKADGITKTHINADVAGIGLGQNADGSLEVNVGTGLAIGTDADADKVIVKDLEVTHLKSGVLDTDLTSVSANDDTLPSAKAVKAFVDAKIAAANDAIMVAASMPVTTPKFDLVKNYIALASATAPTVTIPDSASYLVGKGNLMVYRNGVLQVLGENYTEASTTTVSFVINLRKDDEITFVIGKQAILNYSVAFAYDTSDRINKVTYTGDIDRVIDYTYNSDNTIATEVTTEQGKTITRTYAYTAGKITGITTAIV